MKKILCSINCFLQSMGVARAAACLSRHGHHEAAKRIILESKECKC
jgi:hypothetical protein